MGELVDLAGAKVVYDEQLRDADQEVIEDILGEIALSNDKREIRSIVVAYVDRDNRVTTQVHLRRDDTATLIGALEIAKHDLIPVRGFDEIGADSDA